MIAVEDSLWLILASGVQIKLASWQSLVLLGSSIFSFILDSGTLSSTIPFSKKKPRDQTTDIGLQMSIVMIPTLFQIIEHHHSETISQWISYSKLATLLVIPGRSASLILCAITVLLDPALDINVACFFILAWFVLLPMVVSKLEKSLTFGELRVVTLVLIVICAEYAKALNDKKYEPDHPNVSALYSLVALSGSISCLGFAYLCTHSKSLPWWLRIGINIAGPLFSVDLSLYVATSMTTSSIFLPMSIQWLIKFLTEKENGFERFWGLLYWIAVLIIGSYPTIALQSVSTRNKLSVVVTRKWFHLIAVLLFGPITWQLPELMSLSYAIAVSILVVLETSRSEAPLIQSFYTAFLDDRKDDGGQIIVSHIFLIVGCAAPLWTSQVLSNKSSSLSPLVAEFGVLCIGIGDAMGAVIGKSMGKNKWGKNQRTLEGSLAMWLSMICVGIFLCSSMRDYVALFAATTFTTILEAFTVQLDNLVLPICGTSIILLISMSSL